MGDVIVRVGMGDGYNIDTGFGERIIVGSAVPVDCALRA